MNIIRPIRPPLPPPPSTTDVFRYFFVRTYPQTFSICSLGNGNIEPACNNFPELLNSQHFFSRGNEPEQSITILKMRVIAFSNGIRIPTISS